MAGKRIWGTIHPFMEQGPVWGRKEANAGFLRALLRAGFFDRYHFFLREQREAEYLGAILAREFPALVREGRVVVSSRNVLPQALAETDYACFHLSDWENDYATLAFCRNAVSRSLFPITAPAHSLSYARHGSSWLRHFWPGVSPRDAIVGTSTAAIEVIRRYVALLRRNYSLEETAWPFPELAHVPFGVHPGDFASPDDKEAAGRKFRQQLDARDIPVFLSFSRISPFSKMDVLPVIRAFARAHGLGLEPGSYRFVLAGRMDAGDPYAEAVLAFAKAAGVPCSLITHPDGLSNDQRMELYAAADVFISAADNPQETFGLTLLEAQAASLPVIASDLSGYRDIVKHGETGLLAPTVGPAATRLSDAESGIQHVDAYHLALAQQCVVETGPLAKALAKLGTDAAMRREMGKAGRNAVMESYTWDCVIRQYDTLWRRLAAIPIGQAAREKLRRASHPSGPDFGWTFAGHYAYTADSEALAQRLVRLTPDGKALLENRLPLAVYAQIRNRITVDTLKGLLHGTAFPVPFGDLAKSWAEDGDRNFLLLWALKHDLLEFTDG